MLTENGGDDGKLESPAQIPSQSIQIQMSENTVQAGQRSTQENTDLPTLSSTHPSHPSGNLFSEK